MSIQAAFFGSLGRDAELKTSKAGKSYIKLNCRCGDGESAVWVNVLAFVDGAEELASKLVKGAPVYCEGSIRLDEWTAQDGTKRAGLSAMAWRLELPAIGKNRPPRERKPKSDRAGNQASNNFHSDPIGF
jgi:single-stranded DNA-binding protein